MLALLQNGFRTREPRTKVLVPCRLNISGAWVDACIHNVSSRGMLVATDAAPSAGSYVEVRRGTLVIVGRVVWREDRYFGVRTQDRISVEALVNEPRRQTPPRTGNPPAGERRADSRLAVEGRRARAVERNRRHSATMQFAVLLFCGAVAAVAAGYGVRDVLGHSLATVNGALAGGQR